MTESDLKNIIAARLVYFRKLNKLTQLELAAKINYSDKSVSKWERGEGLPDIYVLCTLAELYGVTVNDLVSDTEPLPPKPQSSLKDRILIPLMSVGLVWLVACIVFVTLKVVLPDMERTWLCFIYALPAACIVATVFMKLWWNLLSRLISVSLLIWSFALSIFLTMRMQNIALIFIVAAVIQVLTILWYIRKFSPKKLARKNARLHPEDE